MSTFFSWIESTLYSAAVITASQTQIETWRSTGQEHLTGNGSVDLHLQETGGASNGFGPNQSTIRIFKGNATRRHEETKTGKGNSVGIPPFRGFERPTAPQPRGELFTAFSYTGSTKTEQGGDNQARHVLTLESGISLPEALFPVKSRKSRKSRG